MEKDELVLGTRGSDLARAQVELVRQALGAAGCERVLQTKIISTTGDRRQDLRLSAPDLDKAVFTKELEEALTAGEIHAAVHSLKDVPTDLETAYKLAAVLPRAPVEDVLVTKEPGHASRGLESLPDGARVATSSLRRAFQLKALRPDLEIVEIRGNVPTRLAKVATLPELDATILAKAGLVRLGFSLEGASLAVEGKGRDVGISVLDPDVFLPAAGQGAVALEIRAGDDRTEAVLQTINDEETWRRIRVERAFLKALGAGCQTPVGIHSQCLEGGMMKARAIVFRDPLGGDPGAEPGPARRTEAEGPADQPEALANTLMNALS